MTVAPRAADQRPAARGVKGGTDGGSRRDDMGDASGDDGGGDGGDSNGGGAAEENKFGTAAQVEPELTPNCY